MRALVVGSGGREHALCWAITRDAPEAKVFCAPGNPGTAQLATNLPHAASDIPAITAAAREHAVDVVVVGPEAPLADGLADALRDAGIPVFGPSAAAARIETSKAFAKDVMARAGVPTAASETVSSLEEAEAAIARSAEPLVIKASGLAAGKGAIMCDTRAEALAAARAMLVDGRFGSAGEHVVIEEFMEGEELSVFALTDGERVVLLPSSQDHKRLGEGDVGPNTGGMGAYTPVSRATPGLLSEIRERTILPTLRQLAADGTPYQGVLYAGLMLRPNGGPAIVEFNCRFGDPEAQVVLPSVCPGRVTEYMTAVAVDGRLPADAEDPEPQGAAVITVLAASGYPDAPRKGDPIDIPTDLGDDVLVFHAGTKPDRDGTIVTSGGRVLGVVGLGPDVAAASAATRRACARISFADMVYRRDIGWRELERAGAP